MLSLSILVVKTLFKQLLWCSVPPYDDIWCVTNCVLLLLLCPKHVCWALISQNALFSQTHSAYFTEALWKRLSHKMHSSKKNVGHQLVTALMLQNNAFCHMRTSKTENHRNRAINFTQHQGGVRPDSRDVLERGTGSRELNIQDTKSGENNLSPSRP